jgi:hypothetical protein
VTRPAAGPSALLTRLTGLLDELIAAGPLSGSRTDATTLLRQVDRLRGAALRELAEMDAVGGHQLTGVNSTTASWLRDSRHLSDGTARATVSLAIALRDDLPFLNDLLLAGHITVEHAAAVGEGVRGLDTDLVRDAADGLSRSPRAPTRSTCASGLRDKAHAIDDRLAAAAERRARQRMGLRLSDVGTHTAVDGTLAGQDGATVRLAMDLAVEADRVDGDTRGKAARQADVLVGWANDYLHRQHGPGDSLADDAHTVRTHLHIVCRPDQQSAPSMAAPLAGRADPPRPARRATRRGWDRRGPWQLSHHALRRLACDATLDLVTLDQAATSPASFDITGMDRVRNIGRTDGDDQGRTRHRISPVRSPPTDMNDSIDVGRSSRTVTGRQFRVLVARDRHCVVKGCRRRPAQCAAHHVRHWADGGATDLDNLVLLCHQHHHDHHDRQHDLPHRDGRRWLTQTGWRHAPP